MADREIVLDILKDALKREKQAEENCEEILLQLRKNGVTEVIEKIKNDEQEHQKIVKKLIEMI